MIRQKLPELEPERENNPTFRFDPFPHFPLFSTCKTPQNNLLLTHCDTQIQLWSLGKAQNSQIYNNMNFIEIPLDEQLKQIFQLNLRTESPIYCSSISPNGQYMAASDTNNLFLFSFFFDIVSILK